MLIDPLLTSQGGFPAHDRQLYEHVNLAERYEIPFTLQARRGETQLQGHLSRDKMPRQAFHIAIKSRIDLRQRMKLAQLESDFTALNINIPPARSHWIFKSKENVSLFFKIKLR